MEPDCDLSNAVGDGSRLTATGVAERLTSKSRDVSKIQIPANDKDSSEYPSIRKKPSLGFLMKTYSRSDSKAETLRSHSRAIGAFEDDDKVPPRSQAKNKILLSSLFAKKPGQDEPTSFISTGDDYERFTVASPIKTLKKMRSFTSFVSTTASDKTITPSTYGTTTHKRKVSKLTKSRPANSVITSADIAEPFPLDFQKPFPENLYKDPEEFRSKEYTRRWFLEEARARKYGLQKPEGNKIRESEKAKDMIVPFEAPRAAPQVPQRPDITREDSIFPQPARKPRPRAMTYTAIDISKYAKY